METKNYFMEQDLGKRAWNELSSDFHWTEETLKKAQDKVDWGEVSDNGEIFWTNSMLERFENKIDWKKLSRSRSVSLMRVENLEKYKARWDWKELSDNSAIQWNLELIDRFIDYWDWKELINNYQLQDFFGRSFLEKYQKYIPESALQNSYLWHNLVEEKNGN